MNTTFVLRTSIPNQIKSNETSERQSAALRQRRTFYPEGLCLASLPSGETVIFPFPQTGQAGPPASWCSGETVIFPFLRPGSL